jgi:hypothetical protein
MTVILRAAADSSSREQAHIITDIQLHINMVRSRSESPGFKVPLLRLATLVPLATVGQMLHEKPPLLTREEGYLTLCKSLDYPSPNAIFFLHWVKHLP